MTESTDLRPPATHTCKVIVRHSASCKDKKRGPDWRKCNCRKSLSMYEGGGSGRNRVKSARTRSWAIAEKQAQEWLDGFDPEKQELKRLRATKDRSQVRIEDAVALYISDMATRLGDNGSVRMARSLFGHVDPETKAVVKNGNLFDWLDTLPQRPTWISEFTPALVTAWRSSWKFGSDLTAAQRWSMVKVFFGFCESQGWVEKNPAQGLRRLKVDKRSRTPIFTDMQYAEILDAVYISDPENVPAETRKAWQRRLETFLELLRWSGMSLIDAIQFRPELVDADGVLRYRRQKSRELATIPLPERLLALLRDIPLERDSVGAEQPFRTRNIDAGSDTRKWEHRLDSLFKLAGITEVLTEIGTMRKPSPRMLRDTFAVGHLRHGAGLHTVAKMLGHSTTATTERSYLPWVQELEKAHIEDARRSLAQALPKPTTRGRKVIGISR